MRVIPHHYYVETDMHGYACRVTVNGYGVLTPWRRLMRGVLPLNGWVIQGTNTLGVRIEAEDGPGVLGVEPDAPSRWVSLEVALERDVPEGTLAGESPGEVLCALGADDQAIAELLAESELELPLDVHSSFELASPFPRWRWQDAEPLDALSPADRAEIDALLTDLYQTVASRDVGAILGKLALPVREAAVAWGRAEAELRAELAGLYRVLFEADGFALEALELGSLTPELHCEGRVVELITDDGRPMIRQVPGDEQWILPLHVGRLDGRWTPVRL